MDNPKQSPKPREFWLRRADQASIAFLVALGFFGTAVWWLSHGGLQGNLVELDRAELREAPFLVDLNQADWPELANLPGLGETKARSIVESRRRDGPFFDHDNLQRVKGIGPRTVERLRPYLCPLADPQSVADETTPDPHDG